jgi:hypothetical protein
LQSLPRMSRHDYPPDRAEETGNVLAYES